MTPPRVVPLAPDALVARLARRLDDLPRDRWWRVLVDGHPSTRPGELAAALVGALHDAGRPAARVPLDGFWRPASLRLEQGRDDPWTLRHAWYDTGALAREVLGPLAPGGPGRYLPSLRDPRTDRSTREPAVEAPPGAVVVLDGGLALGLGLAVDLAVHLAARPATLARRTAPEDAWTLEAYAAYAAQVRPEEVADVVVRVDDPRRPALLEDARPGPDAAGRGGA